MTKKPYVLSLGKIKDMGFWNFTKRSQDLTLQRLVEILGVDTDTSAGVHVNEDSAMRFSAVWGAVRILSETIASLPLNVYKKTDAGKEIDREHPIYKLLHSEPNGFMTSFIFREVLMSHVSLWGNHYSLIVKKKQRPVELIPLHPTEVEPVLLKNKLYYKVDSENVRGTYDYEDILHIPGLSFDGIKGKSPITYARENIGLGLAAEKFGANFFGNGANLSGVLEHPATLSDAAQGRILKSWNSKYSGINKSHKTAVLEEGMKYTRIGIPPQDSQFIETRKFSINEIARIFRIPPHMLADLEKSSFSNIEQQSIEFVIHTIRPWVVRIEQEINRKLFWEVEKGVNFAEFNLNGLLRGDAEARGSFYNTMFMIGAMSPNDIREFENLNKIDGGEKYYVPLNMIGSNEQKTIE